MIVNKTSVFPSSREKVFSLLQRFDTLSFIAKPYATFESIDGSNKLIWEPGKSFSFKFRMYGFIPLGIHKINVCEFGKDGIYTREGNPFCPTWNHRIILKELDNNQTEYTDEVEIDAGWKTFAVYLWAKSFYAHRQRKWLKLLRNRL